jgi:hypothetical protein
MSALHGEHTTARESAYAAVERTLHLVGRHTGAIEALLRVADVMWDDTVRTACVECVERPRLRLNPDFVARACPTPEALAALLLHELWHITLGHTRLFPRPTALHNFAFDAIINRTVLHFVRETGLDTEPYGALFAYCYNANESPWFLLRPPPGWPERPDWHASAACPEPLRALHHRLYDTTPQAVWTELSYGDVMAALHSAGAVVLEVLLNAHAALLGSHDSPQAVDAVPARVDPELASSISASMHQVPGLTPGAGHRADHMAIAAARNDRAFDRALRALMRRTATAGGTISARATEWGERAVQVPHWLHDRRAAVRVHAARQLGGPAPLLFSGVVLEPRRRADDLVLYVDVSGSMDQALPRIRSALRVLQREVDITLFWFSTEVFAARADDVVRGMVRSTGGTSMSAVLRHALSHCAPGTACLLLTDGHFETIPSTLARQVVEHSLSIHLGIVGNGPRHQSAPWVRSSTALPSLNSATRSST